MKINTIRPGAGTNWSILAAFTKVGNWKKWNQHRVDFTANLCRAWLRSAPGPPLPCPFHSALSAVRGGRRCRLGCCSVCNKREHWPFLFYKWERWNRGCQTSIANRKRVSGSSHDAVLLLRTAAWDYLPAKFKGEHQKKKKLRSHFFYLKD